MNRRLLGSTMMVWVKRSNKGRLVVVLVSGSSEVEIGKHKMYRFLRIVRFAFLAGSFGHLLDPMDVENLPS
ncbi:hypothetical protein JHK87_012176 [Glycine soja]|nr:hypothetical protein JHK87_012176 [Glycine soja]